MILVPLEGGWDRVNHRKKASVCEIGILDVLCQPVLDVLSHLLGDRELGVLHSIHQAQMPMPVVSYVVLVVADGGEESLLSFKVLLVDGHQLVPHLLVVAISLHISDNVEKPNVFVIHLLVIHFEALVPDVRIRDDIVSSQVQLPLVGKVSVLDMLSQPVLGHVCGLLWDWQLGGLELGLEQVVLEVVAVAEVALHFAELHLLVVKVHPQLALAEGVLLSIGRVVTALPDTVKQHLTRNRDDKVTSTMLIYMQTTLQI